MLSAMFSSMIMILVGFVIGYYAGNKEFRDKVNKWIKKQEKKNHSQTRKKKG